jgi:hypothetical protein
MPKMRKPVDDDEFGPPEEVTFQPEDVINRLHQNYLTQIGELQNFRAMAESHSVRATQRIRELEGEVAALRSVIEELDGAKASA